MPDEENEDHSIELVMPFVTVQSNDGPHDDQSYTAGYEMGRLDDQLEFEKPSVLDSVVLTENIKQVDLIAMKNGYSMTPTLHEEDPTWTFVKFTKLLYTN